MNYSYQQYLKPRSKDLNQIVVDLQYEQNLSVKSISSSYYAYNKIIQLCENSLDERPEQGQKYFIKTLGMIIGAYQIFARKKNTNNIHNLESRVRIWELRRFVREKYLKNILVQVVRLMPEKLDSVIENRKLMGGLEIKMSKEIFQFLAGDRKFVQDSEIGFLKDIVDFKNKIRKINVRLMSFDYGFFSP